MAGEHICLICNGSGKTKTGDCPLCRLKWKSNRITDRDDLLNRIDVATVVKDDPLKFLQFDRGWDLESKDASANLVEAADTLTTLKEIRERLISIAARNAEQRAEYHRLAGVLEKYKETKDIAKFITEAYQKLRRAWLIIEKTENMLSARIDQLS